MELVAWVLVIAALGLGAMYANHWLDEERKRILDRSDP